MVRSKINSISQNDFHQYFEFLMLENVIFCSFSFSELVHKKVKGNQQLSKLIEIYFLKTLIHRYRERGHLLKSYTSRQTAIICCIKGSFLAKAHHRILCHMFDENC